MEGCVAGAAAGQGWLAKPAAVAAAAGGSGVTALQNGSSMRIRVCGTEGFPGRREQLFELGC